MSSISTSTDRATGSLYYDQEMGDWLIEPIRPVGSIFSPLAQVFRPVSQQPPPAQPIACAVCLAQDSFSEISWGVSIRRATNGKMRCQEHDGKCAYCLTGCSSDTFLLCDGCCNSGAASSVYEALEKTSYARLKAQNRMCVLDASLEAEGDALWACGCVSCISDTSAFYVARSLEEGSYASSASSASSSSSSLSSIELDGSHVAFQITEALLTP